MKKILLIALLICIGFISEAQTSFNQTTTNPTGTITNTSSDTMNFTLTGGYRLVGIQPLIVKASGTAAGTATLYGSINGADYVTTGSALTLTDVTRNTTVWALTAPTYRYFRIIVTGATTVSATASAKIIAIK